MTKRLNGRTLISNHPGMQYNTQLLYFTCSSLSGDDERIYLISDRDGHPNVWVRNLLTGDVRRITDNSKGYMKSYVYFDGSEGEGLAKASVCLDYQRERIYYIQDNQICRSDRDGNIRVLNTVPDGRMTAFTHVSADGRKLCVPMTDGRILDFDPDTEGSGLDKRPVYNIDQRVQDENLSSYLCVYDTESGELLYEKKIPRCWITHVQFNPADDELIMYNHEWSVFDCGIRRINLYDHRTDRYWHVRCESESSGWPREGSGVTNPETGAETGEWPRRRSDWVCHEMWTDDGQQIIYHGGYTDGPAMVGRCVLNVEQIDESAQYAPEGVPDGFAVRSYSEIALPKEYNAYGHFLMDHQGNLSCDGYYRMPGEKIIHRENSTDNGPDPHRKDGAYICKVVPDWDHLQLNWVPLCRHDSDWLGQDAHPHPIYSHSGDRIFFNSRMADTVNVYSVSARTPQEFAFSEQ